MLNQRTHTQRIPMLSHWYKVQKLGKVALKIEVTVVVTCGGGQGPAGEPGIFHLGSSTQVCSLCDNLTNRDLMIVYYLVCTLYFDFLKLIKKTHNRILVLPPWYCAQITVIQMLDIPKLLSYTCRHFLSLFSYVVFYMP